MKASDGTKDDADTSGVSYASSVVVSRPPASVSSTTTGGGANLLFL